MSHSLGRWFSRALVAMLALTGAPASAEDDDASALGFERTPPRLSFTDGEVSYLRPGDADWSAARVNSPLAVGDELATGAGANLELQIGARAYLRAGEATQLGLTALEPDYLQLELTNGTASLDLREIPTGQTFQIDTPNAAFTIEQPGYYRVEVANDATTFISRRGGRAFIQTAGGLPTSISPNEQIVVSGAGAPVLASYGAPSLDDWDRWNYSRSERQTAPLSARYVPAGVYGADDLDDYGGWRTVPTYGAVWVPRVSAGWAPYSAGSWVADPYYGWTWVDDAPWGWAPFHYGRWVHVGGYWGWSPGPRVVRAYYSPALVAFYSSPHMSVSVSFGQPYIGWVALGWGEPVVPWWGPRGCHGVPRWAGWGGPHLVNKVVINNYTTVDANNLTHYQNADRHGGMVAVERQRFGRGNIREARLAHFDSERMAPVRGADLGVRPERATRATTARHGRRPSREAVERGVVTSHDSRNSRTAARPRATAHESRGETQRGARSTSIEAPKRLAQAEPSATRAPLSSRGSARRDAPRGRAAAPPTPSLNARAETHERRGAVSVAPRASRERVREAGGTQWPSQSPNSSTRRSRGADRNPTVAHRERSGSSPAPSPARIEERRRPQTDDRARTAAPQQSPDRGHSRRERAVEQEPAAAPSDSSGEPGGHKAREWGGSRSRRG